MGDPAFGDNVYTVPGVSGVGQYILWTMYADEGFLRTYDIQMASGRFFEKDRQSDLQGVVLNEAAVKVMGLTDPVGRELVQMIDQSGKQTKITILGVIKDFHFQSLHEEIRPLAFHWIGPGRIRQNGLGAFPHGRHSCPARFHRKHLAAPLQGSGIRIRILR